MNILILDQYAGSPRLGMEYRPFSLACEWNRMGHKTLIAAGSFSHLRRMNFPLQKAPFCYSEEGVDFIILPTPEYSGNGLGRFKNICAYVGGLYLSASKISAEIKPDIVIISSTHPFDFRAGELIARRQSAKTVFELHDIWPMSLCELHGFSPRDPLMRLIDSECKRAFSHCDLVASMLPNGREYLLDRGISHRAYDYFQNTLSKTNTVPPPTDIKNTLIAHRQKYGSLVLYAGGCEKANCVDELSLIAKLMPDTAFAAIGTKGTITPETDNFLALPKVSRDEVCALLPLGDVLWIGSRKLNVYRYGVAMNKLCDYLQSGRPILFSCDCKENPVSACNAGITSPAGDIIQTVKSLKNLLSLSEDEKTAMGKRGAAYARSELSAAKTAERYINRLEEIKHAP